MTISQYFHKATEIQFSIKSGTLVSTGETYQYFDLQAKVDQSDLSIAFFFPKGATAQIIDGQLVLNQPKED